MRTKAIAVKHMLGRQGWAVLVIALALVLGLSGVIPVQADNGNLYVRIDGNDTSCNGSSDAASSSAPDCAFRTILKAIDSANPGDTVRVAAGTYSVDSLVSMDTTNVTLVGVGNPLIQVSGSGYRFSITAIGNTIQGFTIEKTDKTGGQDIIHINASNTTIQDNVIFGKYVFGDGEVSRAMVFSAGLVGVTITGNTIYDLRQPAYISGPTTGTISNNLVYRTRGWVLEQGNMTFTDNHWGSGADANVYDIAIIPSVSSIYYSDIPAMSAANHNAFIEDQRTSPATLSIVYVDGSVVTSGSGTASSPKKTIAEGITRVVSGGTVYVNAGNYAEQLTIGKSLHLIGAGSGASIIQAPGSMMPVASPPTSAIIVISGSGVNAELSGFTVTGPGPTGCGSFLAGIIVRDNANANIHDNRIQDVRDSSFSGCQNGVAVWVGRQAWSTSGTATIDHNTIVGYQKGGIVIDNAGSQATITNNTVTGVGTTSIIAQNGIQISRGATATLAGNTVTGNSFHNAANPSDWGSVGILLYQSGAVTLSGGNVVTGNDQNLDKTGSSGLLTLGAETLGASAAPAGIGFDIVNEDSQPIDAHWVNFSGAADGFAIEDRILHQIDDPSYGLVTWMANQVFVTPNSFSASATTTPSIQRAIDAVAAGGTVNVAPGSYVDDLTINKALTLLGPNSAINPNTGARSAEAVLYPATSNPNPATCTVMAYLTVGHVTIRGLTFDGDNPALTSGIMIGSADVDACEIIASYEGIGNVSIENNILKHSTYAGIDFYNDVNAGAATSTNYIRNNRIENIGEATYNWGMGVVIYNNFYADISQNVFTGVRTGIQTGNFYRANPGSTSSISNNQIGVWRLGIFHNLAYSDASAFTISNNTITAESNPSATKWNGILLSSFQSAVSATLSGNTIVIPGTVSFAAPGYAAGYNVWNITSTAPITISGGTVSGGNYGIWVNNYAGYTSDADGTAIRIDGVGISNASQAGIYVQDDPLNSNHATVSATINNSPISHSAVGVLIEGPDATASGACNQIALNTNGVNNTTAASLNFEKNWWGAASGPSGAGLGSGDNVSANVDYQPWNADTTCTVFTTNIAPVANAQSVNTAEDTAKDITLTGSDVNGDTLSYAVVSGPAHGALSGTAPALTYTPAADYSGPDSFTFKVNDGTVDSAPATVSITVSAVNDAPVANAQSVTTDEDTSKDITLTGSDVEGSPLSYTIVTFPTHGTLSGTAPALTYIPAGNYHGADNFTFKVNDGTVDSAPATVSITISAVNDAPLANAQSVTTAEDTAKDITLTGSDVDGDPLSYAVVSGPAHGALSGTAPALTYTPAANYHGADSFTFKVNDGTVDSAPATVSITISAVNDAPVANAQPVTTAEDTAKAITLTGSDVDGDPLSYAVVSGPAHGALSGTPPALTYTPAADYNGADSFTFKVNDGTVDSAPATVSITITSVNDTPMDINLSNSSVPENSPINTLVGTLSSTDPDAGDTFGYALVAGSGDTDNAAFNISDSGLRTSAAFDYETKSSYSVRIRTTDQGGLSAEKVFTITVTNVNEPPTDITLSNITVAENSAINTLVGVLGSIDPDAGSTFSYALVAGTGDTDNAAFNISGSSLRASAVFDYETKNSYSVRMRTTDQGGLSAEKVFTITVTNVNEAPVADAQSVTSVEDTAKAITLTGSDVEGSTLSYTVVSGPTHGALSGTAPALTYTPAANYNGADSFTFKVSDGTLESAPATVSITVSAVNDAPVADAQSVTTVEGIAKNITLTGADLEGAALIFSIVADPAHGTLSGSLPLLTYTSDANYTGSDSFTFKTNDGELDSAPATVSITVSAAARADLAITHASIPAVVAPQATWSITLNIANSGPAEAANLSLSDTLPTGVTFVSAAGGSWTCAQASGVLHCTLPTLAAGSSASLTITLKAPAAPGPLTNLAVIASDVTDPVSDNNTTSASTTVASVPVTGIVYYLPAIQNH